MRCLVTQKEKTVLWYRTERRQRSGILPGCTYDVDVRAGRTDVDAASGEEILYCSSRKASQAAVLNTPKMAELTIAVNGSTVSEESEADGISGILSSQTSNTVRITSTIPVKRNADGGWRGRRKLSIYDAGDRVQSADQSFRWSTYTGICL